MDHVVSAQEEFEILSPQYRAYIDQLKWDWLSKNKVNSRDVYEVMRPEEQALVHQRIAEWGRYITPLAEAWWKERGFGVVWPDDDTKPMQLYKLEIS